MPGFDPSSARPSFDPSSAQPSFDPTSAKPHTPGATGLGMIGETWNDITNPNHPEHDPNALEQVGKGVGATFRQGIAEGPLMNGIPSPIEAGISLVPGGQDFLNQHPQARTALQNASPLTGGGIPGVRQIMEGAQYGRRSDETDQQFHQRYNDAVTQMRQQATDDANAARLDYGPNPSLGDRAARVGQQFLNFEAGIGAHPEYFGLPGFGGSSFGTRILRAGLGNAAIGGVSDAAAQLSDLAEGVKKDYDVTQSLQASLASGAFGAGVHGAIEVAPFIKGLFANRGMDTTPGADPRGSPITPMSQDHLAVNAADASQYNQLLKTGSVEDIKNFFAQRNGPQPSWRQIAGYVQRRDGGSANQALPKFDYESAYNAHAEQQWQEQNRQAVEDHINQQMAGWKNAPPVTVVHGPEDITDPGVDKNVPENAPGMFAPNGRAYIFSGRVSDPAMANSILYHEGLSHFGLAQKFGDRLNQIMQTLYDRNVGDFRTAADRYKAENPGTSNALAMEEAMAEEGQKGVMKPSWQLAMKSAIKQFGRKMGFDLAYDDDEVKHILAMAHDSVINGKGSARDNFFQGSPNKFMYIGKKARNFDPGYARRMSDGELRDEISDHDLKLNNSIINENYDPNGPTKTRLGQLLDHPELFRRYPQLRHMPTYLHDDIPNRSGAYDPKERAIHLSLNQDHDEFNKSIVHEIQHAVQHIEEYPDFVHTLQNKSMVNVDDVASGKTSIDEYLNDPVEREAFATEDRLHMTQRERDLHPNKFITRAQLNRVGGAASPSYKSDDIESIAKFIDENVKTSPISHEEIKRQAIQFGIDLDKLEKRNPGELAVNVSKMGYAARWAEQRMRDRLDKFGSEQWTMKDQVELGKSIAQWRGLIEKFKGEGSELGRALATLNAFKEFTNNNVAAVIESLKENDSGLASLIDPTNPKSNKFIQDLKDAFESGDNGIDKAREMIKQVQRPRWEQYLTTFHMNMMLSALSTHVKAPVDMMTGIARNVEEKLFAMPIGQVRMLFERMTGREPTPGVETLELINHVRGLIDSTTDLQVYRQALRALKTGQSSYVAPGRNIQETNFANQYGIMSNPRIPGISKFTDAIAAQDTIFRSWEMNAQLRSLATREARSQLGMKAKRSDVDAKSLAIAKDPPPSMLAEAFDLTNRTLLLNDNPFNRIVNRARILRPDANFGQRLGSFIASNLAPFIRVESNSLFNRILQRSPLAFLDPYTRSQFAAGGAKADIAMSKIAYGTVLMGLMWMAAGKGKDAITGTGSDDVNRYKEDIAAGRIPDAVKEGGRFNSGGQLGMSVLPWDMHNKTAQMVADLRHALESGANQGQTASGMMLAFGAVMADMAESSWISDFQPAIDAVRAHGQTAQATVGSFLANEARTWLPNIANQIARNTDVSRDTSGNGSPLERMGSRIGNEMASAIPGLRQQLPIKYSVYGDPLPTTASWSGVHTWIPGLGGNGTTETTDPTERELDRLNAILPDLQRQDASLPKTLVTPVQHSFKTMDDQGNTVLRQLSSAEFEEYQHQAGQNTVQGVSELMSTPEWGEMSDHDRVLRIRDIESAAKAQAREDLFEQ